MEREGGELVERVRGKFELENNSFVLFSDPLVAVYQTVNQKRPPRTMKRTPQHCSSSPRRRE